MKDGLKLAVKIIGIIFKNLRRVYKNIIIADIYRPHVLRRFEELDKKEFGNAVRAPYLSSIETEVKNIEARIEIANTLQPLFNGGATLCISKQEFDKAKELLKTSKISRITFIS